MYSVKQTSDATDVILREKRCVYVRAHVCVYVYTCLCTSKLHIYIYINSLKAMFNSRNYSYFFRFSNPCNFLF